MRGSRRGCRAPRAAAVGRRQLTRSGRTSDSYPTASPCARKRAASALPQRARPRSQSQLPLPHVDRLEGPVGGIGVRRTYRRELLGLQPLDLVLAIPALVQSVDLLEGERPAVTSAAVLGRTHYPRSSLLYCARRACAADVGDDRIAGMGTPGAPDLVG